MVSVRPRAVGLLVAMLVAGCSHNRLPKDFRLSLPAVYPEAPSGDILLGIGDVLEVSYFRSFGVEGPYRLEVGDELEVVIRRQESDVEYHLATDDELDVVVTAAATGDTYRLQTGDEISVVVPTRDDLSRAVTILTDGTAVLPVLGPVELRGLTVEGAVATLEQRYRQYLDEPSVDLLVLNSARPALREKVTILPDGSCTLPLLGSVPLRGKTVPEAIRELEERYDAYFHRPNVDLLINQPSQVTRYKGSVLPDGRVTLPLVGAVELEGLTVDEATSTLRERYAALLDRPAVDLLITDSGTRIDEFFEILLESPRGAARDATVTGDGLIRLPLIPPVRAANLPLPEVSDAIAAAYKEVLPEIEVSTAFALRRSQRRVTVLGEVVASGMFEIVQPLSVLQAVALAGGFTDRAWRAQTLLVQPDYREGTLKVTVLDLRAGLRMQDPAALVATVDAQDIVYVPRTRIADVNLFVEQYIASMIPVNLRIDIVTGAGVQQ